ncbi:MAG: DNA replication/repair protein RecF [Actinomycetes bacterium]
MRVISLELVDYRSYPHVVVQTDVGVTTFIGRNGEGKTNLVEAMGYLATLSSHRVASDAPLVRHGAAQAVVRGVVERDGRRLTLEVEINPGRSNRARVNQSPLPRARELTGILRTVLFAPEDLSLVRGDPDGRRRFLDDLLVLRTPRLAGVRADYDRVLKQRNALLRSASLARRGAGPDLGVLGVWDTHLTDTGAELLSARRDLLDELEPLVASAYESVSGSSDRATVTYQSSVTRWLDADTANLPGDRAGWHAAMSQALEAARTEELDRGVTLVGPHRDDVVLTLGQLPAKGYASHGESWSYALALRLASFELLRAQGDDPVLVLDDVFAELDSTRRARLAGLVGDAEQVWVTAAVVDDVPEQLLGAQFSVVGGEVSRA